MNRQKFVYIPKTEQKANFVYKELYERTSQDKEKSI
ncbi:hypothetical protein C5S39_09580 [Candidatus Methanophagaceae archaeon]|nr:hypothetical protein C5S39_09580 [Methanophagales archaeon]